MVFTHNVGLRCRPVSWRGLLDVIFCCWLVQEVPVKKYCKSYLLGDLRKFPGWSAGADPEERELADDQVVFVCDEFTVLISPVGKDKDKRLFTAATPEWREFCTTALKFEIPEDLAFAYVDSGQS
jgi:hypothetical protein